MNRECVNPGRLRPQRVSAFPAAPCTTRRDVYECISRGTHPGHCRYTSPLTHLALTHGGGSAAGWGTHRSGSDL